MIRRMIILGITATALASLVSCAPVLFGGAASGAVAIANNRTLGAYVEDEAIENKVKIQLYDEVGDNARYDVVSINRIALVVGQAPTETVKEQIISIVSQQENLRKILDYVEVGDQISLTARGKDSVITARVKAELLQIQIEGFSSLDVKVLTEDSVVYMMGLITRANAALAVQAAREVSGVRQVIKAFEYI